MPPDPLKIPIRASTQEHLDIEDIKDGIVILKDGSCCLILETNAVNFGLLSETEQDAIIYAYAGLLNSLSFPIQITIRSQRKDVSSYLRLLDIQEKKETSPKIRKQIKQYRQFIENTVKENEVLDKSFYITIPFSSLELGLTGALGKSVGKKGLPFPKEYILTKAKTNLYPKKEQIIRQFSRLGLKAVQLNTQQLIELFYHIYNPESRGQKLASSKEYKTFFVKPAIEETKPSSTPTPPLPQPTSQKPNKNSVVPSVKKEPPVEIDWPAKGQKPPEGQALQKQIEQVVQNVKGTSNVK